MDIVTVYLYGSLDLDIYIKVSDGIPVPNMHVNRYMYCVKLIKSLYDSKQSERMWYNRLKEFLLNKGYSNSDDCPCVFIKKSATGFCIISVYVDDLNNIDHTKNIDEARNHLKMEFEMKDLDRTKFWLGLQLEHLHTGILIHQFSYVQKILENFNMDKTYPAITPMIVCALEKDKDPFKPKEECEEVLGQECSYLSVIGALMYLANNTRSDIAFAVNCLARHRAATTMRHWNGIKNILRYLVGTIDLRLYFQKNQDSKLIGYVDVGYLSDLHNARSQTGYVFLHGGTTIFCKSCKQTLVATSMNHSKIIALYETSRECA
jgi:hypothetical protein